MDQTLLIFGLVTAAGTAFLTVVSVWRVLTNPISRAIQRIEESILRLEGRIDAGDAKRESDIKDVWKFLAEKEAK